MGSSDQPAALLVSPEAPYPLAGGGALRTASLLGWLARHYTVDLIVFQEPDAPDPREALPPGLVRRVTVVPLRRHARHLPARLSRNLGRFLRGAPPLNDRFSGYTGPIVEAAAGGPYELGVVEHFWCAGYADVLRAHCRRLVVDLHNIESLLHFRNATASQGAERVFMRRFGNALERLERLWLPRFDAALVTSTADAAEVMRLAPHLPVTVYPNAIPRVGRPAVERERAIVFSANLRYHPNRGAVDYFYRQIWPLFAARYPDIQWKLVGKHPEAVGELVGADPRVVCTGPVEDAVSEIASGLAAVVPLLAGSGTRVKILEAWAAGVPVVSTPVGAEGLEARDGEEILLAATPEEFVRALVRLLESSSLRRAVGEAGRRRYEIDFTWEAAWQRLDTARL